MNSKAQVKTIAFAIIGLIVGIAIGYGIGLLTITPPPETVTLMVIGPWAGDEMKAFLEVLNKYEEENPNIKIEYRVYRSEDLAAIAPPQFEAGLTPADVLITPWGWWVKEMGEKGHAIDLAGLVNIDEFMGGIFDPVISGNKVYGLPFSAWAKPGFWYKKSFFEKHNLNPPATWEEFVNLLDQLKGILGGPPIVTGDGVGWPISDIVEHFIITFGGTDLQLNLINGDVSFTDPQTKRIFEERIIPLLENGYFSEPIEWERGVELWWREDYALYFMGTWITGLVDDPNDLGVFPLPGSEGAVVGTDYVMVPKYTDKIEESKKLAQWLATEGQRIHVGTRAGKFATWNKVGVEEHWVPMQAVFEKLSGVASMPDLDDTVGGDWQLLFWDQLKLLWVDPGKLDDVLSTLDEEFPK